MKKNKKEVEVIVVPDGKIRDYVDGKFRKDTPEEYVRQTIEKRLVNEHKYLKDQIKIEYSLKLGSKRPRADIVIFPQESDNQIQENIHIIVECKKESIGPNHRKEGVDQLKSYMSACTNCEWGMWTNGKHKMVYRKVINEKGKYEYVEYNDIPSLGDKIEDIDRPDRSKLKKAVENNLLFVFRTCHNHIYATDGMQKQPAFFELLKLIFCKIEDEKNIPEPLQFYAKSEERKNPDGQLTVKKRINKIFEKVKIKYDKIFDSNDEIKLSPRSLSYVVSELQKYSLISTHIDIKGKAYEELVGANLRGDRGEFFTPRSTMDMSVKMINPKRGEKVLDPSCGTGGFIVLSMLHVINNFKKEMEEKLNRTKKEWTYDELKVYDAKVQEIAEDMFGFDINPDLVKSTIMNIIMNNEQANEENIFRADSLLPPHEWSKEFKDKLASALNINVDEIINSKSIDFFDVIVSNPPFGSKIPIKDPHILEQYELAYIWENHDGEWIKTDRLQTSVPPEQLFIERCWQLLKPGGRIAIILPDSILGSPGLGYIRQWLVKNTTIISSIDLPEETFQPRNGTQTSVLVFQKKEKQQIHEEESNGEIADYNIFMGIVEKVGYDKRGNPIFKRDEFGDILLVKEENKEVEVNEDGEKKEIVKTEFRKILDDQQKVVPDIFDDWKKEEGIVW